MRRRRLARALLLGRCPVQDDCLVGVGKIDAGGPESCYDRLSQSSHNILRHLGLQSPESALLRLHDHKLTVTNLLQGMAFFFDRGHSANLQVLLRSPAAAYSEGMHNNTAKYPKHWTWNLSRKRTKLTNYSLQAVGVRDPQAEALASEADTLSP